MISYVGNPATRENGRVCCVYLTKSIETYGFNRLKFVTLHLQSKKIFQKNSLVSTKKSYEFSEIIEIQFVVRDFWVRRFEINFAV